MDETRYARAAGRQARTLREGEAGTSDIDGLGRALTTWGPRFWAEDLASSQGRLLVLDEEESRHASRVLRLKPGDPLVLLDGRGAWARAEVVAAGDSRSRQVACQVLNVTQLPQRRPELVVAAALPKGQLADEMLAQLAQIGAHRFIPLTTKRSVVQPREGRLDRFRRMARVAAKQSGSPWVMEIQEQQPLVTALKGLEGPALLLDPGGSRRPDVQVQLAGASQVTLLVGPEGGWTEGEHQMLRDRGALLWSIGPQVLRIETAALVALGILVWSLTD